jgi:hypothetical protein
VGSYRQYAQFPREGRSGGDGVAKSYYA